MKAVKSDGKVALPVAVLELARSAFVAERISDEQVRRSNNKLGCPKPIPHPTFQTLETIKTYYAEYDPPYVVDPHTAVGLAAAAHFHRKPRSYTTQHHPQIVLSTAHPAKFSEAVTLALSGVSEFNFDRDVMPPEFKGLLEKERRVIDVEKADVELVKKVIDDVAEETKVKATAGSAATGPSGV